MNLKVIIFALALSVPFQACNKGEGTRKPAVEKQVSYRSCQSESFCRQYESPEEGSAILTEFEKSVCENSGGTFSQGPCPAITYCGKCKYDQGDTQTIYSYLSNEKAESKTKYATLCGSFGGSWIDNPQVQCQPSQ